MAIEHIVNDMKNVPMSLYDKDCVIYNAQVLNIKFHNLTSKQCPLIECFSFAFELCKPLFHLVIHVSYLNKGNCVKRTVLILNFHIRDKKNG